MRYKTDLTAEYVREILDYDPDTGKFRWKVTLSKRAVAGKEAGSKSSGYVAIGIGGKNYRAHRIAHLWMTGEWPKDHIDHRDRDRSDNRWKEIRPATPSENHANSKAYSTNKSGFKGVSWCKSTGKWRANITVNYKHICLGRYSSKEEARDAYTAGAQRYFGEHARS